MNRFYIFTAILITLFFGFNLIVSAETTENKTVIKGHWNYPKNSVHQVSVESNGEDVELFLNGISFGHGKRDADNVFIFENVIFQPGDLTAVSYDATGKEISRQTLQTAGTPAQLKLTVNDKPSGWQADGMDTVEIQFEVADFQGRRCGDDSRIVSFEIDGPAELVGDSSPSADNNKGKKLQMDAGVNKALLRSTTAPGDVKIKAVAKGLAPVEVVLTTDKPASAG